MISMRKIMIAVFCSLSLLVCVAQGTLYPVNHENIDVYYAKYKYVYDFVGIKKFRGGKISRIRPELIRPLIHEPRRDSAYNHILDSLGHIDWNNDTVVMVMPDDDIGDIDLVKSKKGIVCLYSRGYGRIDDDYYYGTYGFQEYIDEGDSPTDSLFAKQDSIRVYSLLSFDFNSISNVLKYSLLFYPDYGCGHKYFVYRMVIDKGKIIDTKMLIVPDLFFWRSAPEDFPGQQHIDKGKTVRIEKYKKKEKELKNRIKAFFNKLNIFRDYIL